MILSYELNTTHFVDRHNPLVTPAVVHQSLIHDLRAVSKRTSVLNTLGALIRAHQLPNQGTIELAKPDNTIIYLNYRYEEMTPRPGETTGKLFVGDYMNDSALSWTCITTNQVPSLMLPQEKNKQMTLDLSQLASVKCQVSVPENFKLFVQGAHGKIESKEPHYDLNAQLSEGEINLSPDAKHQYRYNLFVARGTSDTFTSSKEASAHEMSISIQDGKITHSP